jgi:hypothetical protein
VSAPDLHADGSPVDNPQPQPAGSHDNGNGKLVLPQLNRLHEAFKRSRFPPLCLPALKPSPLGPGRRNDVSPSNSPRNGPITRPSVSAARARVLRSIGSSTCLRSTRPRSRTPLSTQRVCVLFIGTQYSNLYEMNGLEEQADNAQASDLYWKPLSWLGTIRPTSANDAFDPVLWETFVSTTLGLEVPVLSSLPRRNNSQM